jgi:hypothetical protein
LPAVAEVRAAGRPEPSAEREAEVDRRLAALATGGTLAD